MRPAIVAVMRCTAVAVLLAGCAGPVQVTEPTPTAARAETCARVMSDLPQTVDGQDRRKTKPGRLSAAWGNPAIVLTCGGEQSDAVGPDAPCFEVNGVGWYAEQAAQSWTFVTLGREVDVQVAVPPAYAPEANALVDLARPIIDHNPQRRPCV